MYSRDVFPKYTGGMPIPENYSGNAIRRTPPPRQTASHPASPRVSVPLTVSPTFGARQAPSSPTKMPEVAPTEPAQEARREQTSEQHAQMPPPKPEDKEETVPAAIPPPSAAENGLSSLLSTLLPPKTGVGGLFSQIGLEEALLLGLFLLLSQSEEEQDTLMLLALLFLYR